MRQISKGQPGLNRSLSRGHLYRVEICGIDCWHDMPPKHRDYPYAELERAILYAGWLSRYWFNQKCRVIDEAGAVWREVGWKN